MLYLLDIDGTLIRSFLREGAPRGDYDQVELLPGRLVRIQQLVLEDPDAEFALITNQAGVAMGYQTVPRVHRKLWRVIAAVEGFYGRPFSFHVCFHHPKAKIDYWRMDPCWRRKPGGGMLEEALFYHDCSVGKAVYVGDLDSDREAAISAGVTYVDAEVFFRPPVGVGSSE